MAFTATGLCAAACGGSMNPIDLAKENGRYREALQNIMLKAEALRSAYGCPHSNEWEEFDDLAAMARAALTDFSSSRGCPAG